MESGKLTISVLNERLNGILSEAQGCLGGFQTTRSVEQIRKDLKGTISGIKYIDRARAYLASQQGKQAKGDKIEALRKTVAKIDECLERFQRRYPESSPNYAVATTVFFGCAWLFNLGTWTTLGTGATILSALLAIRLINERED